MMILLKKIKKVLESPNSSRKLKKSKKKKKICYKKNTFSTLPIWFVDLSETGLWTYAETGLWTYQKPVRARRQKVQLVLVRLAYGQPH